MSILFKEELNLNADIQAKKVLKHNSGFCIDYYSRSSENQ